MNENRRCDRGEWMRMRRIEELVSMQIFQGDPSDAKGVHPASAICAVPLSLHPISLPPATAAARAANTSLTLPAGTVPLSAASFSASRAAAAECPSMEMSR